MTIEWRNQKTPTRTDDLARFEAERGCSIPSDYKAFILSEHGGEAVSGAYLDVPDWNETPVFGWFGASGDGATSIHRRSLGNFNAELAKSFLQFAEDPGGQVFVIDL
jgi:hypothetical protein